MKKHYEILGLAPGATQSEIENAFNKLSKELHPKNTNNAEFFKEEFAKVLNAYNTLSDKININPEELELISRDFGYDKSLDNDVDSNVSDSIGSELQKDNINHMNRDSDDSSNTTNKTHIKPEMFKNVFSFDGRIRRLEYGLSIIIYYFSITIVQIIAIDVPILSLLIFPFGWFIIAQSTKRCHDRNNSGWFQLIPFYGFWLLFADGDIGFNHYGQNPKGINLIL